MVLEIADIRIFPGQHDAFEQSVHIALVNVFPKANGFKGFNFKRSMESPDRYVLLLKWDTLENHTVEFRNSPLFSDWRGLVGKFFAVPPHVEHFEEVQSRTS
jgi:heme-degrading monooxygenase HmoA